MPSKNKPKRLDRNRSWRVARRKRQRAERAEGTSRNRQPRPKKVKVAKVEVKASKGVPPAQMASADADKVGKVVKKAVRASQIPSSRAKKVAIKKAPVKKVVKKDKE